ncbi:uncharacterized protein VTP21DRAFT_9580 [Calcarisporiella thermophila]|uniref:uncharacterized protein n=1 Tax=Calcarisporiella thermophila TaxID=911321 RepID=UPI00374277DE
MYKLLQLFSLFSLIGLAWTAPLEKRQSAYLSAINYYRSKHSAPSLMYSDILYDLATYIAVQCTFDPVIPNQFDTPTSDPYIRISFFNANQNKPWDYIVTTFVNLLWKSTRYVGCSSADCSAVMPDYPYMDVCVFNPAAPRAVSQAVLKSNVLPSNG